MDISLGQCLTSPVLSPSLELVQIRQLSEEDCMTIIMSKEEKQEFILGRSFIYTTYVQCRNPAIVLTIMIHFFTVTEFLLKFLETCLIQDKPKGRHCT